jgi:hypothetical protein
VKYKTEIISVTTNSISVEKSNDPEGAIIRFSDNTKARVHLSPQEWADLKAVIRFTKKGQE